MRKIRKVEPEIPGFQKRKRVAAYARVSMASVQLLNSFSQQVSYYSTLIRKNPDWEYAGIYADEAVSGTNTARRSDFKRLIADCEEGKIDVILVKSVSRFARNTVDLLNTVRHLKALGVEVCFEEQGINSLSEEGELMLTLMASFAQAESESISANVKWAVRKRFEAGIPNNRNRVLGYRWENDQLVVVPEEAEAVKRIFRDFLEGKSRYQSALALAQDGARTINGHVLSVSSLSFILTNPTYTGALLLQKTYVENPFSKKKCYNKGELQKYYVADDHEAIIDQETFEQVQQKLAENKERGLYPYNRTGCKYPFTKMVVCGCCGRHYKRQLWKNNGKERPTWICMAKNGGDLNPCRNSKNVIEDKLMEASAAVLGTERFDPTALAKKVEKIVVQGKNKLIFYMKDGLVIEQLWKHTAQSESWTAERLEAHRARRRECPANTPGSSCLTGKVRCELCGRNYNKVTKYVRGGSSEKLWQCRGRQNCSSEKLMCSRLEEMLAGILETGQFDEEAVVNQVDYIGMGIPGQLTVYKKNGEAVSHTYEVLPFEMRQRSYRAKPRKGNA